MFSGRLDERVWVGAVGGRKVEARRDARSRMRQSLIRGGVLILRGGCCQEERQRKRNCGFVSFYRRADAEDAKLHMHDAEVEGYRITIG